MTALRLSAVSFTEVRFALVDDNGHEMRLALVRVGTGPSWACAVQFPTVGNEWTESTGDAKLDQAIRDSAAEELVRLDAAVQALREGWASA